MIISVDKTVKELWDVIGKFALENSAGLISGNKIKIIIRQIINERS